MEYGLWHIITQPAVLSRLWFTVWQSSLTVVLAVLIGGGLAVLERWLHQTTPRWFLAFCSLVVFLPPLLITTGFVLTYGQNGLVNTMLNALNLAPWQILYSKAAVVLAHSYYNIPLAFIVLRAALSNIPKALEDSAALLGSGWQQRLTQLFWPHLRWPLTGVAALIFLYCFTSFIVPLQLGGHRAQTLEVWLYQEIYLYHHYAAAAWVALSQFLVLASGVTVLLWAQPKLISQKIALVVRRKPNLPAAIFLHSARLVITLFIVTPLVMLLARATTALSSASLTSLWHSQFFPGLGRSLIVAASALIIAIAIIWSTRLNNTLTLVLVALSPITLTFIWYSAFGKGYVSLVGAFVLLLLPVVGLIFHTVKAKQPGWLMNTARVLGASTWQQRWLEWRLTQPAVRRSLALGGILVLGDATLSGLLAPTNQPLVMPAIQSFIASYRFDLGSVALVGMLIIFGLTLSVSYARD